MTAQSFFGRPSQYAAMNSCHRRMGLAGFDWVVHVDVDEYVVSNGDLTLSDIIQQRQRQLGEVAPAAAWAMPSVFYAECPYAAGAVAADSSPIRTDLERATCAGKVTMHRQKLIASTKDALYLWAHYVFLSRDQASKVHLLDPRAEARLVHVRSGYALDDAFAARAVLGERFGGANALEQQRYADEIAPRLARNECSALGPTALTPAQRALLRGSQMAKHQRMLQKKLPLSQCDYTSIEWSSPAHFCLQSRTQSTATVETVHTESSGIRGEGAPSVALKTLF
mmetsp:Transcript_12726/g.42480  ORF Transcript_12726/g.42480 Transcript_12726/m.42480 type:complete len:282 (+) Transcript_12726:88-933(+)